VDFFETPEIMELAEKHAADVMSLSDAASARVAKSYKRVRQDLRDRLDSLPRGTFTAQRMRSVLVQVDAALNAMGEGLLGDMDTEGQDAAELGVNHLIAEIEKWDSHFLGAVSPINIDLVESATNAKNLIINDATKSSVDTYSSQVRGRIAQGLSDGVISQSSTGEMMTAIGKTLLGEEWKLTRIVRTELMGIYSRGKLTGMSDLTADLPDLMKTVWNPMDNRTADDSKYVEKRVEQEDPKLIIPVDEYFSYKWRGQVRRYLAPPDRPNDRSILIPYRKSWEQGS
jgi:hypothetical protein